MAEAQLIISRAGASSVAEIAAIGRPSILIPLASAKRDEQTANAAGLVAAGGATLLRELDLSAQNLHDAILAVFDDPTRAQSMANAAMGQGKPDAVTTLADLAEQLSNTIEVP